MVLTLRVTNTRFFQSLIFCTFTAETVVFLLYFYVVLEDTILVSSHCSNSTAKTSQKYNFSFFFDKRSAETLTKTTKHWIPTHGVAATASITICCRKVYIRLFSCQMSAEVARSVWCLATGWTTGRSKFDPRQRRKDFSSNLCVQTGSGADRTSCTVGTRGSFPGAKARPRRDADHLPPSSAEVENKQELYLFSPVPPWHVVELFLVVICYTPKLQIDV
jgi:hypothetical protein